MTQIIGGHNLGLLDGSFTLLNRNDQAGRGTIGHGAQAYANVANGNLLFQERDIFLPSFGEDFDFVRTYNSRGVPSEAKGWWFSPNVSLEKHNDKPAAGGSVDNYLVTYGDGSALEFVYNAAADVWISTDGAGAFETLQVLPRNPPTPDKVQYRVTRADGSQYLFDYQFKLLSVTDANGVTTSFDWKGNNVVTIRDDSAHVLTLAYEGNKLVSVTDELGQVLVRYAYTGNLLTKVTDREGHVTTYRYNSDKLLAGITLPDGQRALSFTYAKVKWDDHPHRQTDFDKGDKFVLTSIVDAMGGTTTFEYNFLFGKTMAPNDRDLAFRPNGSNEFQGGTTRVVDALGNARAYSNAAEYKAWRVANGYYTATGGIYTNYDPRRQAAALAEQNRQAELIRKEQAVSYAYDPNGQLTRVTDELGFQTSYTYDSAGNLTSITDANGFGAVNSDSAYYRALRAELGAQFSVSPGVGKPVSALTAADKTALLALFTSTFTYDGSGNLLTSRDNAGNVTTYTYTAFNKVATVTSALGHVTAYAYDARQNLVERTDGLGNVVAFEYDGNGNLTKKVVYLDKNPGTWTDPLKQQVTTYSYDAFGNNTQIVDGEGHTTARAYDHFGNVVLSTDGRGGETSFVYDDDNRLLALTDPEGHTTSFAYDAVGNQIAVTDADGHTVTRVYDKNNLLLTTIDAATADAALTRSTQFAYDILGNGTRTTDAEGRVTTYAYDAHRQLVKITTAQVLDGNDAPISYQHTLAYDGESNVVTATDRNGNTTQYLYTVNGQMQRSTDATGNVTEYLYDADLRQVTIVVGAQLASGLRRVLSFAYDDVDQLVTESDTLGAIRQYGYDAPGNVVAVTDADGNTTEFEFDRNNRVLKEIRPAVIDPNTLASTRYEVIHQYDEAGNEVSITDENGQTTTLDYDRDNRLVLVTDANGIQTVFGYDSRDNRTSVAIGVTAHMDADHHVVIDDASASDVQVTTFTYDEFNQLVAATDGVGNALATSDDAVYRQMRGELGFDESLSDLDPTEKAALRELYTEHYAYDRVGNLVKVSDHFDTDSVTTYDALNRVVAVTEGAGTGVERTTTYRYDGNDNLVKTAAPLGRLATAVYDAADRVTESVDAAGVVTRNAYDALGNLTHRTEAYGTAEARTTVYAYDLRGRLTDEHSPPVVPTGGPDVPVDIHYDYDGEGNLVTRTTSAFGVPEQRIERFEYDASGRLTAQVNGEGERTEFEYDGVGNRTRIIVAPGVVGVTRVNEFEYDDGGRLTAEIDGEGVRTEYVYDAADNRIEIIQAAGIPGERHTLLTYDADDRLLSVEDPLGHVTRYAYDQLGNQVRITDDDGGVTENSFDAMGRLTTNIVGANGPHGGIKTTNTYDVFGNVLTSTRGWADGANAVARDERTTNYRYDALDRQVEVKDGEGFSTFFEYDAFGNMTRVVRGAYTGADQARKDATHDYSTLTYGGYATDLAYDALDRLLTTTDGTGNVVRNTYDALGNRVSQTMGESAGGDVAHASTLTFVYDLAGRLIERHTPTGGLVTLTYDEAGNLTEQWTLQRLQGLPQGVPRTLHDGTVVTGLWSKQTYEYDGNGREVARIDSYGTRTEYQFDAVGNQTGIVYAAGAGAPMERTVRFEYDLDNNRTAEIDALGKRTEFEYDALGNLTKRTDALGGVTRYFHDAFHRVEGQLDARNFLTAFTRDSAGNVLTTTVFMTAVAPPVADGDPMPAPTLDPLVDRVTTSVYDRAGRVTEQTAPDGARKTYDYDSTDKLLVLTQHGSDDPDMLGRTALTSPRVLTWQYDDSGRIAVFTNVDGVTETYAYDAANNKIRETIHNPIALPDVGTTPRSDPDRITTYTYNLANRVLVQAFDPAGLNLTQTLAYDLAGNVVSKADSNSHTTFTAYDLENRVVRITDPLTNETVFGYDLLGNLTTVTDARLHTTTTVYDKNNRPIQEVREEVEVAHWVGGALVSEDVSPTTTTTYDAVGNVVQVKDPEGYVTSRWYDATGNLIAQRTGDRPDIDIPAGGAHATLRTYSYDAVGALLVVTQDMEFKTDPAIDLATPPATSGNVRTVANELDLAGRVVRTTYPAIDITSVTDNGTSSPTVTTTAGFTPEESNAYDAFGNLVESTNAAGDTVYAYYDKRGRQAAVVDTAGFLIETYFDDQDNVVQQRKYATPLNLNTISAAVRPTPPAGTPVVVDRIYDTAGRLVEEISPAVGTSGTVGGDVRVVTRFGYDGAGNLTSKTLGYATIDGAGNRVAGANPRTDYYYYDDADRRAAVVGADRVLAVFGYDGNGNLTSQKRHIDTVTIVDLALTTLAALLADVTPDATKDEATSYAYDEADRLITRTDLMGPGTADDLADVSGYDAAGNRTFGRNPDGYETLSRFDAMGQIVESTLPDGSHSYVEYDTGGLRVRAWVGGAVGAAAPEATNLDAHIANGPNAPLMISWNQSGTGVTSWVAWDTVSRPDPVTGDPAPSPAPDVPGTPPNGYAHASGPNVVSGAVSQGITPPLGADTIYFRVMSRDAFGNVAWTAEEKVYVPTRIASMAVAQSGAAFTATVVFSAAVTVPTLERSTGGAASFLGSSSDGGVTWTFTFTGAQSNLFHVTWQAGTPLAPYRTDDIALLQAPGAHTDGGAGWVAWPLPSDGTAPVGNGQFMLVDGVRQAASSSNRDNIAGQLNFLPQTAASSTSAYDALYGTLSPQEHTAGITYTQNFNATATETSAGSGVWNYAWATSGAQQTAVVVTLDPAETARVPAGAMKVSTRVAPASGTGGFSAGEVASLSTNTFTANLSLTPGSSHDIKVWYLDAGGKEVIVEWRRVTVPTVTAPAIPGPVTSTTKPADIAGSNNVVVNYTDHKQSLRVLASETGGSINRPGAATALTVTPGTYVGPVDPGASDLLLDPVPTAGSAGGTRSTDGATAKTYYTQIEYNALGVKIATNEDTGLWRRYGVDATGNVVETRLYGTEKAEEDHLASPTPATAPVISYAAYDARNLEIARFEADVDPGAGVVRAVTRTTYDYARQVLTVVDPGNDVAHARTFAYDGVGNVVRSTDAANPAVATTMAYNVFGQLVRQTDANGHVQRRVYNGSGRLVEEYVEGVTDHRFYTLDAFGRRTQVANGIVGNRTTFSATYDQRDRVTSVTNGENEVTNYHYDGRDNLVWTEDGNGNWFGTGYDGMGRATHQYSFQNHTTATLAANPSSLAQAQDAVDNAASPYRVTLRDEATVYDAFGNRIAETDAEGRTRSFSYAEFGRLASTSNGGVVTSSSYDRFGNKTADTSNYGQNISYTYDAASRLTRINDLGTSTSTTFTYDVAGRRHTEALSAPGITHSYTYQYNANGWMTGWNDASSGIGETYQYDFVGNVTQVMGSVTGNASYLTHNYTYDAADRVLTGAGDVTTYDARGRKATWLHAGSTVTYTYDNADRVTGAVSAGGATTGTMHWTYDDVGNVVSFTGTSVTGAATDTSTTTYTYDTNNVSWKSVSDNTTTTNFDKSGRVVSTVTVSPDGTYTYTYAYNGDGTESAVTASGSGGQTGSSASRYDVNRKLVHVDLGVGDDTAAPTSKDFVYDNRGHIVRATFNTAAAQNYLYANDQPVGEYAAPATPKLDEGNYSVIQNVPGAYGTAVPDFPATAVADHVVAAGETLQSIAGAVYGHPELWFVIADANGLTGSEQLQTGMRLTIPNTVQYAGFTSQTHALYSEGDIVGSKLPNLKSPPPPAKDDCAVIGAIILIVVVTLVAVVATVLTAGALGPAAFAAVAGTYGAVAGVIAGVLVAAAVGAAIAFAASAITQGILIGFELQSSFDWDAVAADTVAGAFSGAAVGLGAIVGTVTKVTTVIRVANVIAQTALEVGGEVSRQYILNGGVTDWTGVAIAGGTAALGSVGDLAESAKKTNQAAAKSLKIADAGKDIAKAADAGTSALAKAGKYLKSGIEIIGSATVANKGLDDAARIIAKSGKSLDAIEGAIQTAKTVEKFAKGVLYAGVAANAAWAMFSPTRADEIGRESAFRFGSAGSSGILTGLGRVATVTARTKANVERIADANLSKAVGVWSSNAADAVRATQSAGSSPPPGVSGVGGRTNASVDTVAAADFARERQAQFGWTPTSWIDAAAGSVSQIVSQFPGVRDLETTLGYNRLLAGETVGFSPSTIASLAAGTVGRVATNAIPLPIVFLNSAAPSPFG